MIRTYIKTEFTEPKPQQKSQLTPASIMGIQSLQEGLVGGTWKNGFLVKKPQQASPIGFL